MADRRYLWTMTGTAAALLALVGGFNYAIDPLGLWHAVNERRPAATAYARIKKAEDVKRLKPDVIVTGTSRAEAALDVGPVYFPGLVSYNFALAASSINEQQQVLEFAEAVHPLKKAVITLDFFAFNARQLENRAYDPARLSPAALEPLRAFWDTWGAVIALDTVVASFRHLREARHPERYGALLPNGRMVNTDLEEIEKRDGAEKFFALPPNAESIGVDNFSFAYSDAPGDTTFRHLDSMLETARRNGTEVVLIIPPVHATYLDALDKRGPEVAEWKKRVAEIARANGEKYGAAPYPLWDFAYRNAFTEEPVKREMKWFWDSNHAKPALGDIVLRRALGLKGASTYKDFGRRLD